ncbi:hypothetical protein AAHC03_01037 [Spirometra sp. Aus1]
MYLQEGFPAVTNMLCGVQREDQRRSLKEADHRVFWTFLPTESSHLLRFFNLVFGSPKPLASHLWVHSLTTGNMCSSPPRVLPLLRANTVCLDLVRHIRHKPWIPKFRLIRQMQPWVRPFDPDQLFLGGKTGLERATASEIREQLKRNGLMPPLIFQDRPINITHSGRIFDEYVPPEGDGKTSLLSTEGLTEKKDLLSKKAKSMRAMRRISKHQPTFSTAAFPSEADAIYKEANLLLPRYFDNESRLLELLTEKAFVEMTDGLRLRTLHWQFKGSLEPPRVVSMRTEEAIGKDNIFAQVTVRFLTQQVLAIYDRFGRLLFGHPTSPVDVLEYIVFENHITDAFGQWRIHGKIVPPWARVMVAPNKTHRLLPGADKTPADSESQLSATADRTQA